MRQARISSATGKPVSASPTRTKATSAHKIDKPSKPSGPNPPTIPQYVGHPDYPYEMFRNNFFAVWAVSANGRNPDTRNMGWGVPNNGYNWFFDHYILPDIAKGVKNFHIHLPHGGEQSGPMSYDQLLEAQEDGMTHAYEHFYERIAEIYQTNPDVRFLCYYGTFRYDPDILPLLQNGEIDKWMERMVDSILPAIKAPNIHIGFDASYGKPSEFGPEHPNYHFMSLIASLKAVQGNRVYGEPRPHAASPWWHKFPLLSIETFWNRSDPDQHADSSWGAKTEDLTGPILRMEVRGPEDENGRPLRGMDIPNWRTWMPQRLATMLFKDADRYGLDKFQVSHGTVRILNHSDSSTGHGPNAESLREIYELAIGHAVEQGWLAPWKDEPEPQPEIVPELRYETLEELSEDQREG